MKDASARLLVKEGPLAGSEFALTEEQIRIGRAPDSDIAISDAEVSRQHAAIIQQEGAYVIKDLGSTNGTFVNGQRVVTLTPLNHGDQIELGEAIVLVFLTTAQGGEPSPVEPLPQAHTIHSTPQPVPVPASSMDEAYLQEPYVTPTESDAHRRRWILGCGCGCLLVVFLCMATLFFLDAYEQGRLLYCGPFQPLFETLLGPLGFSPACAVP